MIQKIRIRSVPKRARQLGLSSTRRVDQHEPQRIAGNTMGHVDGQNDIDHVFVFWRNREPVSRAVFSLLVGCATILFDIDSFVSVEKGAGFFEQGRHLSHVQVFTSHVAPHRVPQPTS